MGFGKNPQVAKAEAAELKASTAKDSTAYEHAWREAGRQWERAANRESDPKRKTLYTANAERARETADTPMEAELPIAVQAEDDEVATPDPGMN
ncbi:MAG: hypothetical protein ABI867_40745 [Kofleriaceae bacterium]